MNKIKNILLNKNDHILSQKGFTIIEIFIALTFLAITLLATANTNINLARNGALARKRTTACNLCQAKIESLKSLGYDALASSQESNLDDRGLSGGSFSRTVTVSNGSITSTKLLTVTVSWADFLRNHTVSLATLITRQ
ncbi:hypothetical protein JW877_09535 [bacterium]|nr:hypothetical protein [bacterium]